MSCTVNLCTFCYRDNSSASVSRAGKVNCDNGNKKEILDRFFKFTQRYFGSSFQSTNGGIQGGRDGDQIVLEACADCFCEVETFCKLYHEWKCLEMKLEWKLKKLNSVIEGADKVARFGSGINKEELQLLRNFRNEFQQKYTQRCSMAFPRVIFKNLMHPTKLEVDDLKPQVLLETRNIQFSQMFLGWISTFTAVLLLGNLFLERNARTNDFWDYKQILISSLDPVVGDGNYDGDHDDDEWDCSTENKHELHLADNQLSQIPVLKTSLLENSRVFETSSIPKLVKTHHRQKRHLPLCSSPPHKIRRPAPDSKGQRVPVPFRCYLCARSFNSYSTLLRHRRAFTHYLTKLKRKPEIRLLKIKRVQQKRECDQDNHQINVGVLRPRRSIKRNVASNVDPDRTSNESENGDTSDYDDDDWNSDTAESENTVSSDTSISSSNDSDDPEFTCSNCAKNFSNASARTRHEKICQPSLDPSCTAATGAAPVKKEKKYYCDRSSCNYRFESEPQLLAHQRLHGSFACKNCSVVEDFAPALAIHELTHQRKESNAEDYDENERHFCPRCNAQTRSQKKYISHFVWHHLKLRSGTDLCSICKVPLLSTVSKGDHFSSHHDKKRVDTNAVKNCKHCPAYFLKTSQLQRHLNMFHDGIQDAHNPETSSSTKVASSSTLQKQFYCDVNPDCRRNFESENDLENHRKLHGKFACSMCPVVTSYAPKLAFHEASHFSNSLDKNSHEFERRHSFMCSRCPSTILGMHKYTTHFLTTHLNLPSDSFTCQNCGDKFPAKAELRIHVNKTHDTKGMREEDISKCDQCPAFFSQPDFLYRHKKRIHFVEANTTCVDCGRKYMNSTTLRMHRIKAHKKNVADYPFPCDIYDCEKRFENEVELFRHKKRAHREKGKGKDNSSVGEKCLTKTGIIRNNRLHKKKDPKRYVCEECGKVFKAQIKLEIHQFSHSGPESWKYSCIFCDKKSATEQAHMEHIKAHTDEKPYICEICGEEYAHGRNLRDHKNKKHNANELPRTRRVVNDRVSRKGQKLPRLKK
ncbi:unnamed protein product [Orchesella dallaii]|uniref:C2H2-type domain-containing protein n=1 Tax=Orchesella dallaii TaxID=48710 RepID=A0ABP1RLF8_9HEXA